MISYTTIISVRIGLWERKPKTSGYFLQKPIKPSLEPPIVTPQPYQKRKEKRSEGQTFRPTRDTQPPPPPQKNLHIHSTNISILAGHLSYLLSSFILHSHIPKQTHTCLPNVHVSLPKLSSFSWSLGCH